MTRSFVTGATGLIGRHLVDRLLARGGAVSILLRPGSRASRRAALERWGERVEVWPGDVTEPGLGLSNAHAAALVFYGARLNAFLLYRPRRCADFGYVVGGANPVGTRPVDFTSTACGRLLASECPCVLHFLTLPSYDLE